MYRKWLTTCSRFDCDIDGCSTNTPFYRIAGSLLAELGLGLLIKGAVDLASAGLLGHGFNPPTDRGAHEERHFLEFGFGLGLPMHRGALGLPAADEGESRVENRGLEPLTSAVRSQRSTS